mmetsp:Transcript_41639/g.129551  ORF Transcript_41639/g.129551 Transcript_41639/m.129551 type:complete len:229 (-) Transcript_41639:459-1145(-)
MLTTSSCQCPWPESCAEHQAISEPSSMRSRRSPPKVISLSSLSETARKTAKSRLAQDSPPLQEPEAAAEPTKLNSGVCERLARPRPSTPSKAKLAKGSSVMSMAETSRRLTQPRCGCSGRRSAAVPGGPVLFGGGGAGGRSVVSSRKGATLALTSVRRGTSLWMSELPATAWGLLTRAGGPRQTWSRTKMPVTSPVPKETVIWSRACQGLTTVPSTSMSSASREALRR